MIPHCVWFTLDAIRSKNGDKINDVTQLMWGCLFCEYVAACDYTAEYWQ